jgi:hypothetical protein
LAEFRAGWQQHGQVSIYQPPDWQDKAAHMADIAKILFHAGGTTPRFRLDSIFVSF